jgi:hypothetical protein
MDYEGSTAFEEMCQPYPSKSPFGLDTVNRKFKGAAPLLRGFLNSLSQGSPCPDYTGCYLSTWTADDNPVYPEVVLSYVGLLKGNLPDPIGEDEITLQNITVTTETPTKASREIEYEALTTRWRYIERTRSTGKFKNTSYNMDPFIRSSVIRTEDGKVYTAAVPIPLFTALTPPVRPRRIALTCNPVPGTPFFECEETICRMYLPDGATGGL